MNISRPSGLTLTELVVASAVVSIILLGITSASVVLQKNSKDFSGSYFVSETTAAMISHMLGSAALAVGSGITGDKGILIGAETGSPNASNFCVHQNVPVGAGYTTNAQLGSDRWMCYMFVNNQISYCDKNYNLPGISPNYYRGADSGCAGNAVFLGTARSVTPTFTLNSATGSQQVNFSVTIANCMYPSAGNCAPGNAGNPYTIKTGSVSPAGHGL